MDYFFVGGGGKTLLLRDGWDAVSQFSGRDGRQLQRRKVGGKRRVGCSDRQCDGDDRERDRGDRAVVVGE